MKYRKNTLQTKITDIKYSLKRLDSLCKQSDSADTLQLLQQAMDILDLAIETAGYATSPDDQTDLLQNRLTSRSQSKEESLNLLPSNFIKP